MYKPKQRISLDEAQIQCAHRVARVSFRASKNKPPHQDVQHQRVRDELLSTEKQAPVAVADYNRCMGFVDSMNHM
jgi:hypothetical protein